MTTHKRTVWIDGEEYPWTDTNFRRFVPRKIWNTPLFHFRPITEQAQVVDGSLVQPVTNPARLLEEKSEA